MPPGVKSVDSVHTFHTFHTNSHILATNIRGTDGLPFTLCVRVPVIPTPSFGTIFRDFCGSALAISVAQS